MVDKDPYATEPGSITTLEDLLALEPVTRAGDTRGHSQTISLRVPPGISRAIAEQIQSGRVPYTTATDWVRDAISLHLHITRMRYFEDSDVAAQQRREHQLWRVQSRTVMRAGIRAQADQFVEALEEMCANDDQEAAASALQELADTLPQDTDQIVRQYGAAMEKSVIVGNLLEYVRPDVREFLFRLLGKEKADVSKEPHKGSA